MNETALFFKVSISDAISQEINRMVDINRHGYEPGSSRDRQFCINACEKIFKPIILLPTTETGLESGDKWSPAGLLNEHEGYTHPIVCSVASVISGEYSCKGCPIDSAESIGVVAHESCYQDPSQNEAARDWTLGYRILRLQKIFAALKDLI